MGLDMIIYAHKYDNTDKINEILKIINNYQLHYIKYEIMYWRKFYPIHNWFVENIMDGNEDIFNSKKRYIPREKLYELKDICENIINNHQKASILLPNIDENDIYDEYYFDNIKYTYSRLEIILNEEGFKKDCKFYYLGAW